MNLNVNGDEQRYVYLSVHSQDSCRRVRNLITPYPALAWQGKPRVHTLDGPKLSQARSHC